MVCLNTTGFVGFEEGMQQMVEDGEKYSFYEHYGVYVSKICELARIYAVKLDPNYFNIAMALKVMEGVSLSLNKDLDMITKCLPIIARAKALRALGIMKFPADDRDDGNV
jgi:predicted unusual protein kinase regulating ubiquinone biosynthesis (AarF/ABC1/UbiB family)